MSRGRKLRINGEISAPRVSVIGPDGESLGEMLTSAALLLARWKALDLVEVNPEARPPVCKLIDFQKWKYETAKARVQARYKDVELEIRDNQIKEKE